MSPFLGLFFWTRRASLRARAFGRLMIRLALLVAAVAVAVREGPVLVAAAVVVAALVALIFVLGTFTVDWRNAHVTVGRQYRRLKKRGPQ